MEEHRIWGFYEDGYSKIYLDRWANCEWRESYSCPSSIPCPLLFPVAATFLDFNKGAQLALAFQQRALRPKKEPQERESLGYVICLLIIGFLVEKQNGLKNKIKGIFIFLFLLTLIYILYLFSRPYIFSWINERAKA